MADTTPPEPPSPPATQPTRSSRPVSEALLNDKVRSLRYKDFKTFCSCLNSPAGVCDAPESCLFKPLMKIPANNRSAQWDHAISSFIVRSSLGAGFGIVFSVLLFKRRAWPAFVGLGFGAGRAWEEADGKEIYLLYGAMADERIAAFRRGGSTGRDGLRVVRS